MTVLLSTVFAIRGRINFTNLARFCPMHEQTFRRHFQRFFDWVEFNLAAEALAPRARGGGGRGGAPEEAFRLVGLSVSALRPAGEQARQRGRQLGFAFQKQSPAESPDG